MARSALLNVMVESVRKSARSLARDFGEIEQLQSSVKGSGGFATASERKAAQVLREELLRVRSGYGFVLPGGEEIAGTDTTHRWIVEPLDASVNFSHAVPLFAVSVALERQGVVVAGVIYNPVTDELYSAERGSGAFLNDHRLRVGARTRLADAVVGTSILRMGQPGHAAYLRSLGLLMNECAATRSIGCTSLALAWVAAGRLDGHVETGVEPTATAAGLLLVREAGGFVSDEGGRVIAGNEAIQRELVALAAKG